MDTTPDTEQRRERYKAAMRNIRVMRDGKNEDRRADAVMAVADQELRAQAAEVRAAARQEAIELVDTALTAEPNHNRASALYEVLLKLRDLAAAARPDADMAEVIARCPEHGTRTETYPECRCAAAARPDNTTGA